MQTYGIVASILRLSQPHHWQNNAVKGVHTLTM